MTMNVDNMTHEDVAALVGRWRDAGLDALDFTSMWLPMNTTSVTAAYTVTGRDKVILADATGGPFTVTLPDAALRKNQQPITVKRINAGGNAVTIGSVNGTIDGAATVALAAQYALRMVVSNGTNWLVVGSI